MILFFHDLGDYSEIINSGRWVHPSAQGMHARLNLSTNKNGQYVSCCCCCCCRSLVNNSRKYSK
jgi:hypothetical protein